MVTKGSTRTQTADPAAPETLQAACQAHALAQIVYGRLASGHPWAMQPPGPFGPGATPPVWGPGWEGAMGHPLSGNPVPFPFTYYPR